MIAAAHNVFIQVIPLEDVLNGSSALWRFAAYAIKQDRI